MSLREHLRDTPVMLEVIPPHGRASEAYVRKFLAKYWEKASDHLHLDACNLPEIVEENHRGEPFYKNMDPREFALRMGEVSPNVDVVVNKIVVHLQGGTEELAAWAEATRDDYGILNVVAVGGNSSQYDYPGPTVPEANRVLREAGLVVGNIMIPEREGEPERMLAKTLHGAQFFTTQVIFAADALVDVLEGYQRLCEEREVTPATVFTSFAPASDEGDLAFLRWLGVRIPPKIEKNLREYGAMAKTSILMAEQNWEFVLHRRRAFPDVPLGLNVEYINRHNFAPALEMARRLRAARVG